MRSICLIVFLVTSVFSFTFAMQDNFGFDIDPKNYKHANSTILVGNPPMEIKLDQYLNHEELKERLGFLNLKYKSILKLHHLGNSIRFLQIWAVQISTDVRQRDKISEKPKFKYVANMHGNEAVGYALMVSLIQYLVYSYEHDTRVTELLKNIDIWIVPTLNPDGFRVSEMGKCEKDKKGLANTNGIDLDTDFPNYFSDKKKPSQIESELIWQLIKDQPFVLSGNLRGGNAIVASYPLDYKPNSRRDGLTLDTEELKELAKDYARNNSMMAPGTACGRHFTDGIQIGIMWNKRAGSMQDFSYLHTNCFELTFYLSCCHYPHSSLLPLYWERNLESMLKFMESTLRGVYGQVICYKSKRKTLLIVGANIKVAGKGKVILSKSNGRYWRLLNPGKYNVTVSATGFRKLTREIELTGVEPYKKINFVLKRKFPWNLF